MSDPSDIQRREISFYEELYKSEFTHEQTAGNVFLDNLPQLSKEANAELSKALTLEELKRALQSMQCGKAPGVDGLPVNFYKSFWPEVSLDLLEVLGECLTNGRLPISCRRAVLTLLPKKGD